MEMLKGFPGDAFSRRDETDDALFYQKESSEIHLDSRTLSTIEELIGRLVVAEKPIVLDLMAGRDSHIPDSVRAARVIGLGLDEKDLSANRALSERVVHDLNRDPHLPLASDSVDTVLCTVSVEYMTRPVEVMGEVSRVLKPGGLLLVVFSNRFVPAKVVKFWRDSREDQRLLYVMELFTESRGFDPPRVFVARGRSPARGDHPSRPGTASEPVYAVYADKRGGADRRRHPPAAHRAGVPVRPEDIEARKSQIKHTLCCPYCDRPLEKWYVPDSPFTEWPNDFFYVCFNDACSYFAGGWTAMAAMGNFGSYRFMYDPLKDGCYSVPVLSLTTARG